MKVAVVAASLALVVLAGGANAQSPEKAGASPFEGFKIGGTVDHRRHEGKFDVPTTPQRMDDEKGGFGYRGFVGIDKVLGNGVVVGAEAGIGNGGKKLRSNGAAGNYSLDPQWSGDASARVGVTPSRNILVYGRAGYNWMQTQEELVNASSGQTTLDRKRTRGGFLWGVGAEFAVTDNFAIRTEFNQTDLGDGLKAARLQLGGALRF